MRGRVLAVVLTVVMVLTFGLMMLAPASAGAFPGKNGMIAFTAPDPSLGKNSQIYVMNPDGTGVKELTQSPGTFNGYPAWSPDGTKIAFSRPGSGLYVMNADGSAQTPLTSGTSDASPSWSPDGTKIAFSRPGSGLYVMNADGSAQTPLTTDGSDGLPSWSPDGTKIAFSRMVLSLPPHSYLYVLTVATLSATQLSISGATEEVMPCWSPDGSQIVFVSSASFSIYVVSANGGTAKLILSSNPPTTAYEMPYWSPDGTKIAFDNALGASIYVMNADGSNPTDVTPSMPDAMMANWQRLPLVVGAPVGGFLEPVNKLTVFAPYLALFGLVATVAVVAVKPRKKTHS